MKPESLAALTAFASNVQYSGNWRESFAEFAGILIAESTPAAPAEPVAP